MPTLSHQVPTYRRHKASGQAVVTIHGRDYYLGNYGSVASRREYNRLVGEYLQRDRRPIAETPAGVTVVEVLAAYWKYVKQTYDPISRDLYARALSYVRALYADQPAADFGPLALKAVRQRMLDDPANLSRTYINDHCARITRMFKWAAAEEMVSASVPQALTMVAGLRKGKTTARENPPVMPVEDAVVDKTIEKLPPIVADMVRLQRLTGMRPAELCRIRPCDIDRSRDVWVYVPEKHKTERFGRPRTIFIGPKAQGVLLRYLARNAKAFCFSPADTMAKLRAARSAARKTRLSSGNRPGTNCKCRPRKQPGNCYMASSYRRAIHAACKKAKVERWSPNQLRHTAATEIRREFGLEAAQVILGHSRADTTQIYAERDLAKGVEVAKRIG